MADSLSADVAIVGAGPGGLAASIAVAGSGRTALLITDAPAPGGQIWRRDVLGHPAPRVVSWMSEFSRFKADALRTGAPDRLELVTSSTVIDGRRSGDEWSL